MNTAACEHPSQAAETQEMIMKIRFTNEGEKGVTVFVVDDRDTVQQTVNLSAKTAV